MHSRLHVEQLDLGALVRTRSVSAYQHAQAGAVDMAHITEIQQEVFLALLEHVLHRLAHYFTAFT